MSKKANRKTLKRNEAALKFKRSRSDKPAKPTQNIDHLLEQIASEQK